MEMPGCEHSCDGVYQFREFSIVYEWLLVQFILTDRLQALYLSAAFLACHLPRFIGNPAQVPYERRWQDTPEDGVALRMICFYVLIGENERHSFSW